MSSNANERLREMSKKNCVGYRSYSYLKDGEDYQAEGDVGPLAPASASLVSQGAEVLQIEPIFRSAGGALHTDQVVDRTDRHSQTAADRHRFGRWLEVFVAACTARRRQAIEGAEVGRERETVAVDKRPRVQSKRHVFLDTAQLCVQLAEGGREMFEVRLLTGVTDIEILRDRWRTPELTGDTADHDELDLMALEHPDDRPRIEATVGHRRAAPRNRWSA